MPSIVALFQRPASRNQSSVIATKLARETRAAAREGKTFHGDTGALNKASLQCKLR
jgi:hypothetical protein